MKNKFDKIPVDEGTKILIDLDMNLGKYSIRYQKWFWDGIYAESFIFLNQDIETMSQQDIIAEAKKSDMVKKGKDEETTYTKGDTYTFVNFNFVIAEDTIDDWL